MRKHENSSITAHTALGTLKESCSDLWEARELLYQFCLRNVRIRYKQAIMGFAWAVLMPVLIVSAGLVIRFATATLSGREIAGNAIATMAVKAIPWSFFSGAMGFAVTSLTNNGSLLTKIHFPREVLPVSTILAQVIDTSIGTVVILLLLPFLGVSLHMSLVWVPLLALMLFLFTCAAGLIFSVANLFFRDVKYLVQVLITYGIFFTPVLFEPVMLGEVGAELVMLNPLLPSSKDFASPSSKGTISGTRSFPTNSADQWWFGTPSTSPCPACGARLVSFIPSSSFTELSIVLQNWRRLS